MDGWGGFQKDLYQGEEQKGRHPPASLRCMASRLHAQTGCRKVYAGEVSEWQKNPVAAEEAIGHGGGGKYANSQFSDQSRQDAISRVSAVQNSARGPRWEDWRSGGWNTRSHQQCRLRRNGNDSYSCHHSVWRHLYDSMHAAQKPKSKLKFVTLDKESDMSTLWRREEFLRICRKEGRRGQRGRRPMSRAKPANHYCSHRVYAGDSLNNVS